MPYSIISTPPPATSPSTNQTGPEKLAIFRGSAHPLFRLRSGSVRIPCVREEPGHPPLPGVAAPLHPRLAPLWLLMAMLLGLFASGPAAAQFEPATGGELTITAPWFGVGGVVRQGEHAGIRLAITDLGDRQREVLIRITMPDPDGDRIQYERTLTTNPGYTQPLWMYVRLPFRFRQGDALTVTAYAAVEQAGPGGGDARWMYAAGRVLATTRIAPRNVLSKHTGTMGIVGERPMGLMKYAGVPGVEHLPAGHERTEVVHRLTPETLPDRWMGLMQFDTIVWNEPSPRDLPTESAQALREWVMRGGHLVVVLPRVGQAWSDEARNPLHDLLPHVAIRRVEGVDLTPYAPLITRTVDTNMPTNEILHIFTPEQGAALHDATCILAGPPGEGEADRPCIAVRRAVGTGMVTLIGLDVASLWMTRNGLPDAELFWHRILGRRGELITGREQDINSPINISREPLTLDRDLSDQIAKTGRAAAGVLIGFVVFIAYWLVAGPLGYAVLRRRGLARHGWLAFVAAAALFTAIAWGGATAIKPQQIEATHLTFLDHVYGQPVQRTRTWASLLVPEYGEAAVTLGDPLTRGNSQFVNVISPWEPDGQSSHGFPDAREYRLESRAPDHVVVPVRATVKQFQFDWAGGPRWRMPRPVGDPAQGEPRIRLVQRGGELRLEGTLMHELPATMKNVHIIVVTGQKDLVRALHLPGSRFLLSHVYSVTVDEWAPNTHLNLAEIVDLSTRNNPAYGEDFFRTRLLSGVRPDSAEGLELDSLRPVYRYTALALYTQLDPPDTRMDSRIGRAQPFIQRKSSHGWDLGPWFAQPSVIIIGHVGDSSEGAPSPTPIYVSMQGGVGGLTGGGQYREVPTSGRTVVRWVYPLASAPPAFPLRTADEEPEPDPGPRPNRGRGGG
jgi:hypothetical protein